MLLTSALRGIDISVQASPCRQRDFVRHFHGMVEGRVSEIAKRGKERWWVGINEERERESERERERARRGDSLDEHELRRYNFHKRENYSDQSR